MPLDLVLLHAPSVFDFRSRSIFYGPISDVVPSTPIFEMYPVGLASIAAYLEERGRRTRLVNLAYRMLDNPSFDPKALIGKLQAPLFGIDLHWLPHAHGSLAVAELVKEIHPKAKVVFGGLSSSYYHRELINYPQVDFVLRGDSTEAPLLLLVDAVKNGGGFEAVPNLTWKDAAGRITENPLSHVPDDIDYADFSYRHVVNQVFRYRDLKSVIPFQEWLSYPITMPLMCRGCIENCVICGGSSYAFKRFFGRSRTAFRSAEKYTEDISRLSRMTRAPIFLVGDIRQPGPAFTDEFLDRMRRSGIKNEIIYEFFWAVDEAVMKKIAAATPRFSMEISPETHDESVRLAAGKSYNNIEFENTIHNALKFGARKVDIFYMVGIPRQTYGSVMDTVAYSGHLIRDIGRSNVFPFISPLAPFLDPGSIAFEESEKVGYKMRFRSLEEHRRALTAPSWKHTLNYESAWMSRDEIAQATYEAALKLNDIKAREGIIEKKTADSQREKIVNSMRIMREIDEMESAGDGGGDGNGGRKAIRPERLRKSSASTLIHHRELQWMFRGHGIRIRHALGQRISWLLRGKA